MTEREMFEKSFLRPRNFLSLSVEERWAIDKKLGILDWEGTGLSEQDKKRIEDHYIMPKKQRCKPKSRQYMKIYLIVWHEWLNREHFVLITAKNRKEMDKLLDKWKEDNPDKRPVAYTTHEITLGPDTLIYLNQKYS